jgi:hypothetical protein
MLVPQPLCIVPVTRSGIRGHNVDSGMFAILKEVRLLCTGFVLRVATTTLGIYLHMQAIMPVPPMQKCENAVYLLITS